MPSVLPLPPRDAVVPDRRRSMVRSLVVGMLIGAVGGGVGAALAFTLGRAFIDPTLEAMPEATWLNILVLFAGWFVAVTVHEVGHLLGGFSQGFRFVLLVVGPLKIDRDAATDRVTVGFNRSLELAGGVAACMPVDDVGLVAKLRWLVIGGPLASVVLTVLCLLVVAWRPLEWWSGYVLLTGVLSGLIGIVTMIPAQNGSFVTDGKRFLELSADTPQARRDAAILLHTVRDRAGTPLASVPSSQIAAMLEPVDGSMHEVAGRTYAYLWLVDRGEVTAARPQLARAAALADGLPFSIAAAVALEQAFAAAWFDRDAAAARALVAPHAKTWALLPAGERARYDAALAIAEGRSADARAHIALARAEAAKSPTGTVSGGAQWTLARLQELEQQVRHVA